jgi:hypothetical protein
MYYDMMKLFAVKAKGYTTTQCRNAVADIDATLALYKPWQGQDHLNKEYIKKLYAERDAMLDKLYLLKETNVNS